MHYRELLTSKWSTEAKNDPLNSNKTTFKKYTFPNAAKLTLHMNV